MSTPEEFKTFGESPILSARKRLEQLAAELRAAGYVVEPPPGETGRELTAADLETHFDSFLKNRFEVRR